MDRAGRDLLAGCAGEISPKVAKALSNQPIDLDRRNPMAGSADGQH
jgi:hypothetical protein